MRASTTVLLLALAVLPPPAESADPLAPESVLGFRPGDDRKLADWGQMVDYFGRLGGASPRVRVERVGRTTEGNPFLVVTITSEANMARLEEIRRDNLRLFDPRGLSEEEAQRIVARGKAIVAMTCSIHSTEVGGALTALELAHLLGTSQDPAVLALLEEVVLLLVPSQNPDGTQRVAEWYRQYLDTPFEGVEPPFLYNRYTGHDNNRDWYMFTQAETRLTVRHVHDRWRPQILHDVHQMLPRGARIFVPPYVDPYEPNVDPSLRSAINALGAQIAARLSGEGKKGVVIHALFDAWSPARFYPHTHGGVRILSETASARLATPVEVSFAELRPGVGYDPKTSSWNFPDPWPGGRWRLRDIVDYQLSASRAILEHAAGNREYWLRRFLEVGRRAVTRAEPFAFLVPGDQPDPLAAATLLGVLRTGAVEVHRARTAFQADGRAYPAGTHVILMQQPASAFAKSLLERQRYPDLRLYPGGPPQRPYDVTAHTLPLLMGVAVDVATAPFKADLEFVAEPTVSPGRVVGAGAWLAFGHANGDLLALSRLLRAGVPAHWALEAFSDGGRSFAAGTLLVPAAARATLSGLARDLGLLARGVNASPRSLVLRRPRIGLYRSWVPSMDEGWTRFVFERQTEMDYETLRDEDVRAGRLRDRFDALVLPDQLPDQILRGHPRGSLPEEYTGGLGKEGVESLKAFAAGGGTLVALNAASGLALEGGALDLPVVNVLAGSAEGPDPVYCPGALLRVGLDGTHPLAHGLPPETPVWFESGPAFDIRAGRVVARYGGDPLLSGWLLGGKRLSGHAALVEVPLGRGRVVLFGFRPQYRAQSWATYIPFLNALYLSAASPAP